MTLHSFKVGTRIVIALMAITLLILKIYIVVKKDPSTTERIAQLLTQGPNAIICQLLETAANLAMEEEKEEEQETLCVVCLSDFQQGDDPRNEVNESESSHRFKKG